jgi:hypothetical protein
LAAERGEAANRPQKLLDGNFGAGNRTAAEGADFALFISDHTVMSGVNGEITAHFGTFARSFGHTDLPDNNLTGFDRLATIKFNAKTLAWAIVDIFGGAASFNMTHPTNSS